MQWVKSDAAPEQIASDQRACRQAAWREAQFNSYWYQHRATPVVVGPGQVIWPSGAFADPFAQQFIDENRLTDFCMEARGYQLVPAPGK